MRPKAPISACFSATAQSNVRLSTCRGNGGRAQNLDFFAEAFYTRLRQKAPSFVDVKLRSNCPDAAASTVFSGTNIVATGKSGCYSLTSEQDRRNKEDTLQMAAGADWQVTDNFTMKAEIDATTSKVMTINIIPDTAYNYPADGFSFDNNYQDTGGSFVSTVGNPQDNPNNLILDQLFDQRNKAVGADYVFRADGEYRFSPSSYHPVHRIRLSRRRAQFAQYRGRQCGAELHPGAQPDPGLQRRYRRHPQQPGLQGLSGAGLGRQQPRQLHHPGRHHGWIAGRGRAAPDPWQLLRRQVRGNRLGDLRS